MVRSGRNSLLFRVAFARARPCYCYGCICLTPDERAYQRRVFRLARAWRHEVGRARPADPRRGNLSRKPM